MSNNIVIQPIALIPAYGGQIKNGRLVGYGSIRDNINKVIYTGYFSGGLLQPAPIESSYIEWTAAPESIVLIIGSFSAGKLNGNNIVRYVSTGNIYCEAKQNDSSTIARKRYIRANKFIENYSAGVATSSNSIGQVTLLMNWVNNNLLNAFDIGDVSLASDNYELDNTIRPDSDGLLPSNKTALVLSILA